MSDQDYLNLYYDCLNHHMRIKKYIPVKDKIFKICDYDRYQAVINNEYNYTRVDDIKSLIRVFSKIIHFKKYENLDEYIDFIISLNDYAHYFPQFLNAIIFKNEIYNKADSEDANNYYYYIDCIIESILNDKTVLDDFYGHSRFVELLRLFLKYYDARENLPDYERKIRKDYYDIGIGVIGDIYATDVDLSMLDNFLNDLANDYENVLIYLELNGLLRNSNLYYGINHAYEAIKDYEQNKRLIR